jgi:SAM-dependent methyltransferase
MPRCEITRGAARLALKAASRTVGRFAPATTFARSYPGIPGRVHAGDLMLRSEAPEDLAHYVSDARSAMENVEASLHAVRRTWDDVKAILDLPSGYGRVTRFLAQRLGPERVTACDVDRQGVRFCVAELGVAGIVANRNPARTRFPRRYDVVFVGSLLTHLTEEATIAVLRSIVATLSRDGLLVVTTQGESCLDHMDWYGDSFAGQVEWYRAEVARVGHAFRPYPGRRDYGVAIHGRAYVERLMTGLFAGRLRCVRFAERGWDRHQDVWTYVARD